VAPLVLRFLRLPLAPLSHSFPSRVNAVVGPDQGLFATDALAAGTTVERFAGPTVAWRDVPVAEVRHAVLIAGDEWMVPTTDARFINHSCAPNCTVDDTLAVVTTRPVAAGEELTFSYDRVTMAEWLDTPECYFWDARWTFDCRCGSPDCVGRVDRYRVQGYQASSPVTPGTKLRLAPVPGKGRGVFATERIAAGELFERAPVIISPDIEWPDLEKTQLYHYCFEWGPEHTHTAIALGYASLYNHSFTPNARYLLQLDDHLIHFVALRDIAVGEEIVMNYNGEPTDLTPVWFELK
jgi:hypothetical protein